MATLTSHLLSALDGSHAADVAVCVVQRTAGRPDIELARSTSDSGGRISIDFQPVDPADDACCEFVVDTGQYFSGHGQAHADMLPVIAVQFAVPDPAARYHIPLMIAPHSYSVWVSPPGG